MGVGILCTLAILLFIYSAKKSMLRYSIKADLQKDSIMNLNDINYYLEKNILFSNKYSSFQLNDSNFNNLKQMRNDDSTKYSNLNVVIKSSPYVLFLRYTEIGCDMCSDITITKLKELRKKNLLYIYILVDFTNIEPYLQWRKGAKVDFDVFYVKKGSLPLDKDSPTFSYLFLIDNNKIIRQTFIPNSGYPNLIDDFLKIKSN